MLPRQPWYTQLQRLAAAGGAGPDVLHQGMRQTLSTGSSVSIRRLQ